ncbi:hypothetical protein BOX15_Mlig020761g1 [Macrostomum lignano]|uniref:Uncharacterized protein n=1 Tax=Macrostomum lignano TaxID=282301 RepID=A0A267FVM3_9PLAT|nr:hypothetical protein BOX15_Mlig020761g1 [Macrostomum lignano]
MSWSPGSVGAEDFLARYAPNLSRKERGSLTGMIRAALRDYMTENRLAQPPPPRLLAPMLQQRQQQTRPETSGSLADGGSQVNRRPATARGWTSGMDDDELCLVGSATGIRTGTPRYAQVSSKFAPEAETVAVSQQQELNEKKFPDTLMGFADAQPDSMEQIGKVPENRETKQEDLKKDGTAGEAKEGEPPAAEPAKRPASSNWLTWRGATPFCASDRELRAFRHRQNPRKPMPEELPHAALYRRPRTARGRLLANENIDDAEKGILSWMQNSNEHDKQVAYNLIKAIGSSRGGGSRGIGLEGLGIEGAAVGASNRGGGLRQQVRGLPLPPPEDRHTFGKRTRPPTPHRLPRSGGADATASTMLSNGLRNNYASVRLRAQSARTSADYVHLGSGFTNACPPYRSNFVVHPDWVSEVTAPAPLPRPTRRAVNQK